MREILFRGKRVDNGEWAEGYLGQDTIIGNGNTWLGYVIKPIPQKLWDCGWFEIDPDTVGQYTGLKDKNGKRIFEGDILAIARKMDGMGMYYSPAIECPVNAVVRWDMCAWMWETITTDKRYISFPDAWCHFECEVIGNIHDNKELLEGGAEK